MSLLYHPGVVLVLVVHVCVCVCVCVRACVRVCVCVCVCSFLLTVGQQDRTAATGAARPVSKALSTAVSMTRLSCSVPITATNTAHVAQPLTKPLWHDIIRMGPVKNNVLPSTAKLEGGER